MSFPSSSVILSLFQAAWLVSVFSSSTFLKYFSAVFTAYICLWIESKSTQFQELPVTIELFISRVQKNHCRMKSFVSPWNILLLHLPFNILCLKELSYKMYGFCFRGNFYTITFYKSCKSICNGAKNSYW